ncbi:hypothetical protein D3C85_1201610 [compost metagenome]
MGHQQREIQLLGGGLQGLDILRRLHVLADHQAGHLGQGQAFQVDLLLAGIGGNADSRGHQQIALAQPLGGVGEFADMGPAHTARQASRATEQTGTQ